MKKPTKRAKTRWKNVVRYPDGMYYAFIKPLKGGSAKEYSLRTTKASMVPDALKIAEHKAHLSAFSGSRLSFDDTIDDYIEARRRGEDIGDKAWKPRTLELNVSIINTHLRPFFGRMKLVDIEHNAWSRYVKQALVGDYQNHRNILRNYLLWCQFKNWIGVMPLGFKLPDHVRRQRRILTPDQIRALVSAAEGRTGIFIHLCLFHGLRGDEATNTRFSDIYLEHGALIVPDSKTNVGRVVPLLPYTRDMIAIEAAKGESPYLFAHRDNPKKPAAKGWFRKGWARTLRAAGLTGITPHDLRAVSEKYASRLKRFTSTEREKMFGSSVQVQNSTYITQFFADELRGMEAAMIDPEKGVEGLDEILRSKGVALGQVWNNDDTKNLLN